MNFGELKTALMRYGFDETDPIETWINAAKDDVVNAHDWPFLAGDVYTETISAGTSTISLPANFSKAVTLKDLTHGRKITPLELTEWDREIEDETEEGLITYYVISGLETIQFWRVPDSSVEIQLRWLRTVPDLSDDADEPDLPSELHYAIVQQAASIALQAENEEERARTAEDQFQRRVDRVYNRLSGASSRDEPRTVTDVMGYGG